MSPAAAPRRAFDGLGGGFFLPLVLVFAAAVIGCGPRGGDDARRDPAPADGPPERAVPEVRLHTPSSVPSAHPSDGEGTATVTPDDPVVISTRGTWTVEWTAGPSGLDPGDAVVLQISPFWGWSAPQVSRPALPGYTTVSTHPGPESPGGRGPATVEAVEGEVPLTLIARVRDGRLEPGDIVRFVYGDPSGGESSLAQCDRYAEEFEEFLLKVDGNGDGFFAPLAVSPGLRILPGPPALLAVAAPTQVSPGVPWDLRVTALDRWENRGPWPGGDATLRLRRLALEGERPQEPKEVGIARPDPERGGARATLVVDEPGLYRVEAALGDAGPRGRSELIVVGAEFPFGDVLWADLHCHSSLSDGTGSPAELYAYARDVAGLDVCAVTDHDAHGLAPLADGGWDVVREATERFHDPGRFVTILGYEWTSWTWGHRNVYYPGTEGDVFSFLADGSREPAELWARIAPFGGVTIPHHPLGGPVPVDWSVPSDEERETVVEICSVHGSSEATGVERGIYRPVPGHSVRDALDAGNRLGLIAAGDTHDGHPGRRTVGAVANGLAALRTDDRTRAGVLTALAERRVYGTSGPRILVASVWGSQRSGQILDDAPPAEIRVEVAAPEPVEVIELVGPDGVVDAAWGGGRRVSASLAPTLDRRPTWRYVRVVLADGEVAWDSPWWIRSRYR
jgi:hypothetical protein